MMNKDAIVRVSLHYFLVIHIYHEKIVHTLFIFAKASTFDSKSLLIKYMLKKLISKIGITSWKHDH
jgi:hypothetical protein